MWYNDDSDIFYISLKKGAAVDSEEINEDICVESGKAKKILVIEIHHVVKMVAQSISHNMVEKDLGMRFISVPSVLPE